MSDKKTGASFQQKDALKLAPIGVVGDLLSVMPFKAFGFEAIVAERGMERNVFEGAAGKNWTALFVTEDVFEACEDLIEKLKAKMPIMMIPCARGGRNLAAAQIKKAVVAAISSDLGE